MQSRLRGRACLVRYGVTKESYGQDLGRNLQDLHQRLRTKRAWYTWLRRPSQRTRLNLARFRDLLRSFPLPRPRIVVPLWGRPP